MLQERNMKKRRNELLLMAGLILIILALFGVNWLAAQKKGALVEVSVEGKVVDTFHLNENVDIVIRGYNGGTNHLIIKDGGAFISEASCPDKVCVRQGTIRERGQSIVCLPNKMIVTIK